MKKLQQTGSALIVSLIMLTSVTFLAVLSLQSSTTQIRIVSNLQIKEDVFHTSKRELATKYDSYRKSANNSDELLSAVSLAGAAHRVDTGVVIDSSSYRSISSQVTSQSDIATSMNYNWSEGNSVGYFAPLLFEIHSTTVDKSDRFKSEQVLGFMFSVPTPERN